MRSDSLRIAYMVSDLVATAAGWTSFYVYRYGVTGSLYWPSLAEFMTSEVVTVNLIVTPFVWLALHALTGYYRRPFFRSHVDDLVATLWTVAAGVLAYFFAIVIDDIPLVDDEQFYILKLAHVDRGAYVEILATMFALVFVPVYAGRSLVTHVQHAAIRSGRSALGVLVVGSEKAFAALGRIFAKPGEGYTLRGRLAADLAADAPSALATCRADVLWYEPDGRDERVVYATLRRLLPAGRPILLRATHDDMLSGRVRTSTLTSLPVVEYGTDCLPPLRRTAKRAADIFVAAAGLIVLSPLLLALALMVRRDGGPAFYSQERLGRLGRPFRMWKLRSMRPDAESGGPQLASADDPRVTPLGRTLRKYRLDELPQLWNVLVGDMSLVGPRPERPHYVDQIVAVAPHYVRLLQLRPGITSWGMVRYGYASTVFAMVERMRYDLMYLDNCTMAMDLRIIAYTIRTVVTGKGQ